MLLRLQRQARRLAHRLSRDRYDWSARAARMLRARRGLRVLVAPHGTLVPALRAGLRGHPHHLTIQPLDAADPAAHDLIVPLRLEDALWLARHPEACPTQARWMPACPEAVVRLCDDKLALNRRLIELGHGDLVPALLPAGQFPCVLKGRWSVNSRATYLIADAQAARPHADLLARDDHFCQRPVVDPREYASHILMAGGRIRAHLTWEYLCDRGLFVDGSHAAYARGVVASPHLARFEQALAALGFEGLCCIDHKTEHGQPRILEINPRLGASLSHLFGAFLTRLAALP